eukprot:166592-Hanusia_phi.AAC.1
MYKFRWKIQVLVQHSDDFAIKNHSGNISPFLHGLLCLLKVQARLMHIQKDTYFFVGPNRQEVQLGIAFL